MRGVNKDTQPTRRRKKVNVAPGKSIAVEDLKEPSSGTAPVIGTVSTPGADDAGPSNEATANGNTSDGSESDVESDSISDDVTSTDTSTDAEEMETANWHEDSDDAPLSTMVHGGMKPEVGQFYVVKFEMGKQISRNKHYVGKILDVDNKKQECEVMFAHRTARTSLIFTWPAVVGQLLLINHLLTLNSYSLN